jgi:hypothetical protein
MISGTKPSARPILTRDGSSDAMWFKEEPVWGLVLTKPRTGNKNGKILETFIF